MKALALVALLALPASADDLTVVLTRYAKAGAFPDGETIVHTITALDPQHVLVWKPKRAPSKFPFKEAWLKTTDFLTGVRVTLLADDGVLLSSLASNTSPAHYNTYVYSKGTFTLVRSR